MASSPFVGHRMNALLPSGDSAEGQRVRAWIASAQVATLCTLLDDERARGWPYGTLLPYTLGADGRIEIVISALAVHTKNLLVDNRASLLIAEPSGDPQAGWRITLVGAMHKIADDARGPDLHGFSRWAFDVATARWIAGFGAMGWL
ncbi:MAG TPA: pyridoxamine 5'-phosphate oxidase family protein [Myxococcota bacterium]|jgi:hypothetical protein